jgi:hypothetical protein
VKPGDVFEVPDEIAETFLRRPDIEAVRKPRDSKPKPPKSDGDDTGSAE